MKTLKITSLTLGYICLILFTNRQVLKAQVTPAPNIIFVTFDDLNDYVEDLGGQIQVETPNLTLIANSGTSFINSYCSSTQCGPSRASMISGKDPYYTHIYNNPQYKCKNFRLNFKPSLDNETVFTLPEWLKDSAGYFTYSLNKIMHCYENLIDYDSISTDPCDKDFSWNRVFYFTDSAVIDNAGDAALGGPDNVRWSLLNDTLEDYMEDNIMIDSAIAFINAFGDGADITCGKPFFLGVGFLKPHLPYFVPEKYYSDFYLSDYYSSPFNYPYNFPKGAYPYNGIIMPPQPDTIFNDYNHLPIDGVARSLADPGPLNNLLEFAEEIIPIPEIDPLLTDEERIEILEQAVWANSIIAYMATIKFIDDQFGRLLTALQENPEIYNNTIIVITSDHGFSLGEKKHFLKGSLWETDTRVPLIIADLRNPVEQISYQTVSNIDLFPTICDLVGVDYPNMPDGNNYLDGKSLAPILIDNSYSFYRPALSTYSEKDSLDQGACFPQYSLRDERFHYIKYATNNEYGLYDCNIAMSQTEEELYEIGFNRDIDPFEWNNLIENDDYIPVKDFISQWLPGEDLYLQKSYTIKIQNDPLQCLLDHGDTLVMNFNLYDTTGALCPVPANYHFIWTNNLTDDSLYGNSVVFPTDLINEDDFLATNRLFIYLTMLDTANSIKAAFDIKYFYLNEINEPEIYFNTIKGDTTQAIITDLAITGTYNDIWWDFGDGTIIEDDDPEFYSYAAIGTYTITCYVQYGNDTTCIKTFSKTFTTNIKEYFKDDILWAYPNPARNIISVSLKSGNFNGNLLIYDNAGRCLTRQNFTSSTSNIHTFDVNLYPSGIYYLYYIDINGISAGTQFAVIHKNDPK